MGLPLCDICGESLWAPHECDVEKIRSRVKQLEQQALVAESKLENIRDAVFRCLAFPGASSASRLWEAAQCQWDEFKSAGSFLAMWLATHNVLCEAFDLFRSNRGTTAEKLKVLRDACDRAAKVLGYNDNLDMTPEKVVAEAKI